MEGTDILKTIKGKVKRLADRKRELETENAKLSDRLSRMEKESTGYQQELADVKKRLDKIKVAKTLDASEKNTDTKYQINQLVKEIDRCIAMLSS